MILSPIGNGAQPWLCSHTKSNLGCAAEWHDAQLPRVGSSKAARPRASLALSSAAHLEERLREARARFEGRPVPRPPFWSGFRVVPTSIEFWTRDPARLHERQHYERDGAQWTRTLLYP